MNAAVVRTMLRDEQRLCSATLTIGILVGGNGEEKEGKCEIKAIISRSVSFEICNDCKMGFMYNVVEKIHGPRDQNYVFPQRFFEFSGRSNLSLRLTSCVST